MPFSFELFPPRNAAAESALAGVVRELIDAGPEFVSVTYGANGSSRDSSLAVLDSLLALGVNPMAHLTCVGLTVAEASRLVRQFLDAGITKFLALRGDPPAGSTEVVLGDLRTAGELVQLIHRVQAERVPYSESPLPGLPHARKVALAKPVDVAVAAFPNGHPSSDPSRRKDIDALFAKQVAGATLAITQLFWDPHDWTRFTELAASRGVTIPITAGLVVPTSLRRLVRSCELAGERPPAGLLQKLENASSPEDAEKIGIDFTVAMLDHLIDAGVPGVHLYTFNQHRASLAVLDGIGALRQGAV
ncbi:methylenetetrahydrofolate reductase [Humidisolicoccus flavus]|uniref:methylenetetrahydrofolate reductase n=1 Tax=Humidisolicoccus flavus TaxID=3111414 RepID=UPI003255BF31